VPKKHRIEPDPEVVRRLGTMTLALPEAYEEEAWTGVRWRIRQKTFAHVMVAQEGYESSLRDLTGISEPTTVVTFHSSGDELLALSNAPLPFYKPPWSATTVGLMLGDGTDWTEVAELLTESYRCCAPQKLVRLIDERSVVLSLLGGIPDLEDLGGEAAEGGGNVTHR
jgi:YjbR